MLTRAKLQPVILLICCVFLSSWGAPTQAQTLKGVNLAGAAFSPTKLPGIYGQDFVYPTENEITYFTDKGMNVFRLSILWERLQPQLNGPLDQQEVGRLTEFIAESRRHGATVIIDLHNYGRYRNVEIGQGGVTDAAFADVWTKLARQFGGDSNVMFGLMNEPELPVRTWQAAVQQAINGIRATSAANSILVSGTQWDSASGFVSVSGSSLGQLKDPKHSLIFEVHEYFDADSSGTNDRCVDSNTAMLRLTTFTQWLRASKQKGFLGEFAASRRPECLNLLGGILSYLRANSDVWQGWTYWAAGPAWGDYMFTLEPANGRDRPQMLVLQRFLASRSP